MISQLPVDEQLDAFQEVLSRNEVLTEVLSRSASLGLPGWYLTAGCLFQTVWNVVTSRAPGHGIKDYDLLYFDAADLSWKAEDAMIRSAKHAFADIPAEVEIRNEARVHLWYKEKFGTPCPAHTSTEDAIDSFAATTCCLGGPPRTRRGAGASTPRTGCPTCSTSSSAPTRSGATQRL